MIKRFIIVLIFLVSFSNAQIYELSIDPNDTSTYEHADFKIWIDESIDTLAGVYWFIHGFNLDSREIVNDLNFQFITSNKKFALMGVHLSNMNMNSGIGDAVLSFMDSISVLSNRPELSNIPFFINGYSWGGQFGYHFARWIPEKILGLISQKGGYHDTVFSHSALEIPMLLIVGENDLQYRIENLSSIFYNHRQYGAKWAFLVEKNASHAQVSDDHFLNSYFNEVINMRLNDNTDYYQPILLNNLIDSTSWLGNNKLLNIDSWGCYLYNQDSSSWLISRKIANHWKKFNSQDTLLIEYNLDINEDCLIGMDDVLFLVDILLNKKTNNLFVDYNQDLILNIFDFYIFVEKIYFE